MILPWSFPFAPPRKSYGLSGPQAGSEPSSGVGMRRSLTPVRSTDQSSAVPLAPRPDRDEDQHAAVGRPARPLVLPAVGQQLLAPARRRHDADAEIAGELGEGDQVAARAPHRRRVAAAAEADPLLVRAVGVHHVELLPARAVALEHDAAAVGRIAAAGVDARRGRQPLRAAAAGRTRGRGRCCRLRHREEDEAPVGREARREGGGDVLHHQPLPPRADVVDVDRRGSGRHSSCRRSTAGWARSAGSARSTGRWSGSGGWRRPGP